MLLKEGRERRALRKLKEIKIVVGGSSLVAVLVSDNYVLDLKSFFSSSKGTR